MSAVPPACKIFQRFLRANFGRGFLGACTGQDFRALEAFAHLLDCYGSADEEGRTALITCMGTLLRAMQPKIHETAKAMIPAILDYGFVDQMWPGIQRAYRAELS